MFWEELASISRVYLFLPPNSAMNPPSKLLSFSSILGLISTMGSSFSSNDACSCFSLPSFCFSGSAALSCLSSNWSKSPKPSSSWSFSMLGTTPASSCFSSPTKSPKSPKPSSSSIYFSSSTLLSKGCDILCAGAISAAASRSSACTGSVFSGIVAEYRSRTF